MSAPAPEDVRGDWVHRLLRHLAGVPHVPEYVIASYSHGNPHRTVLTPAEVKVVQGFSYGMTAEMIADAYGVSIETVRTNMKTARFALRAKNAAHTVALALRTGQIT